MLLLIGEPMTQEEAVEWLTAVNGQLYKSSLTINKPESWVAVVRTESSATERAKLIIALGETMQDATSAAISQWRDLSGKH